MERDKIIEQICSFYDFELEQYFFVDRYDDFDVEKNMSPDRFKSLIDKYDISITDLAKECYDRVPDYVRKETDVNIWEYKQQLQGIGTKYKKQYQKKGQTDNTEKEYIKAPLFLHKEALRYLLSPKLKRYPMFNSLSVSLKLTKMFDGIIFLRENNYVESNFMGFSTKNSLLKVLQSMENTDLKKLLDRLQNNAENDTEEYDDYSKFLDTADVRTLLLLKYIHGMDSPEQMVPALDAICSLSFYISRHTINQQSLVLSKLRARRTVKKTSTIVKKIMLQSYPQESVADEWTLRYREIPEILQEYIDDYDAIPQAFLCMTPLIWEMIQHIFRTFINPCGKNVENFFKKI